jgi:nitroimidazol reductase NimA-like FMN-containing flavoprotein (pyridoxamine 5'-phosphate oxidase superfamily)
VVENFRQYVETLDPKACGELLRSVRLGRIAATHAALPVILPVAFALHGHDLIFKGAGVLAHAAEGHQIVCFEAGRADDDLFSVWSVSAIGELSAVLDPADIGQVDGLQLVSWSPSPSSYFRLTPQVLTGWTSSSTR